MAKQINFIIQTDTPLRGYTYCQLFPLGCAELHPGSVQSPCLGYSVIGYAAATWRSLYFLIYPIAWATGGSETALPMIPSYQRGR